jgi:hypothetical protein
METCTAQPCSAQPELNLTLALADDQPKVLRMSQNLHRGERVGLQYAVALGSFATDPAVTGAGLST